MNDLIESRPFPIIFHDRVRQPKYTGPHSVPWSFIAPHEKQAIRNHDQTLKLLAERGGLSPLEMLAIVRGQSWREFRHTNPSMTESEAGEIIRLLMDLTGMR